MGEYGSSEDCLKKSMELNLDNKSLRAESMAGLAVINMNNNNVDQAAACKESAIRLDYRINDARHVLQKLQWSAEFIAVWGAIPFR
jgi:hypothetical protein